MDEDAKSSTDLPAKSSAEELNLKLPVKYGRGNYPLTRFCVQIGGKKIRLKIVDVHETNEPYPLHYNNLPTSSSSPPKTTLPNHPQAGTFSFSEDSPILCQYCDRSFLTHDEYWPHLQLQHGQYDRQFRCSICSKAFTRNISYRMHLRSHEKENSSSHRHSDQGELGDSAGSVPNSPDKSLRYFCSYCEKKFHYRRDLVVHERVHTKERPYSCGYCQQTFSQSQALTVHIRTHTGERPYQCKICPDSFKDSSALKKHEFLKHNN